MSRQKRKRHSTLSSKSSRVRKIDGPEEYRRWERLRDFVEERLGVRPFVYMKDMKHDGEADCESNRIWIRVGLTQVNFAMTYIHECIHIYCYNNDIWPAYHKMEWTPEGLRGYLLTIKRAEKWVHNFSQELMKEFDPRIKEYELDMSPYDRDKDETIRDFEEEGIILPRKRK